jgi:hypothetical protein
MKNHSKLVSEIKELLKERCKEILGKATRIETSRLDCEMCFATSGVGKDSDKRPFVYIVFITIITKPDFDNVICEVEETIEGYEYRNENITTLYSDGSITTNCAYPIHDTGFPLKVFDIVKNHLEIDR